MKQLVLASHAVQNLDQQWNPRNMMCVHISRRTEIAKSAERPKVQGLFAENALADTHTSSRKFGALTTTDREVPNEECGSRNNDKHAVIVQDLATQWLLAYPCKNKNFTGNGKARAEKSQSNSDLHRQFVGIW